MKAESIQTIHLLIPEVAAMSRKSVSFFRLSICHLGWWWSWDGRLLLGNRIFATLKNFHVSNRNVMERSHPSKVSFGCNPLIAHFRGDNRRLNVRFVPMTVDFQKRSSHITLKKYAWLFSTWFFKFSTLAAVAFLAISSFIFLQFAFKDEIDVQQSWCFGT